MRRHRPSVTSVGPVKARLGTACCGEAWRDAAWRDEPSFGEGTRRADGRTGVRLLGAHSGVAAKASAAKGSAAKKTDDIDSYIWRLDNGHIGLPGEYLRQSVIMAAKYRQDPRSPRKSAMDLYKAAVVALTDLADLGTDTWDYLDQRRVTVQRSAVTRMRPAFHAGWVAEFELQVQLPEYVQPADLLDVLINAGRLVGVGDFRPTYGRFQVTKFHVVELG